MGEVTSLAADLRAGRPEAKAELLCHVQEKIRALAAAFYAREYHHRPSVSVSLLVAEVNLRLWRGTELEKVEGEGGFQLLVAEMIRHILVDHARRRKVAGRFEHDLVDRLLNTAIDDLEGRKIDLIALDESLAKLRERRPMWYEVVARLYLDDRPESVAAVAQQLRMSEPTLRAELRQAWGWLLSHMGGR